MPHAQCLCVQYQVVPSLEETANRLSCWVDGGEDAGLEQAFGEWKAQKWPLTHSGASSTMKLSDEGIPRSLGAKAKNYNIYNPATGEYYRFKEGTRIQIREVFAGYVSERRSMKEPQKDSVNSMAVKLKMVACQGGGND